ncbi:hypothetical protein [Demetria terragena]|uniref:hypothetical protein n=1 Tax=Demetria terragena TaxID=63959 RepID=UPI0003A46BCF|nr:hypothetical protein [Demetria terragena]
MAFICDQCEKRQGGRAVTTVTGRTVCARCDRDTQSAAAGVMAAESTGGSPVGGAIATMGWRERFRRAVGKK